MTVRVVIKVLILLILLTLLVTIQTVLVVVRTFLLNIKKPAIAAKILAFSDLAD